MGLYSGGLIIGRIFAFEIWGAYFFGGGGGLGGGACYRNITISLKAQMRASTWSFSGDETFESDL